MPRKNFRELEKKMGAKRVARVRERTAKLMAEMVALMIRYGCRVADIPDLPWYHPTLSEVMIDLGRDLTRQLDGPG